MKQSDYKTDALFAAKKLETISPTMCLAKWNQVSLHLPTGLTNSCYHPPVSYTHLTLPPSDLV